MKKLIIIFVSLLIILGWGQPIRAQNQSSTITEQQLQQRDELATQAFSATNKGNFAKAEELWTEIIKQFPENPAVWSNRGNSRVSQNKLQEALADYNRAIELAPNVTDPYLNRGTAFEGLGKWEEAIADYNHVLELDPKDPMAYNNRGNAKGGLGKWADAIADYKKSTEIAPNFAFARANYALALYETGQIDKAIREMRNIARKYSQFADVRAALTAAYWVQGQRGEAESNWVSAVGLDGRYKDINWVKNVRRWPPSMVVALNKFLTLK
ncbi:tetratricopeptide repeat protein [Aetokthonos hydrillicola Thurmond2011]|jgi:tetratricopeptide (TPR) repeat protein|uniref:Tetratricopeptide repeat protein n=1 Tax=Aetokthonos hydrillicola Thurmond2011 TaxID=2712845 RepID=A0AAP5I4S1_9CYAN|nr:tetratricopeptide repeat protein [Aetokthonos hydrillicola]MBW4585829.1 tetratricopeptide repeat protein [Aetokthonos hydrillicola CCALA 1050]MDR9895027.1 tetratricopeptide repeat protein [Aetokthonos hydrillicola Thurmond2011]